MRAVCTFSGLRIATSIGLLIAAPGLAQDTADPEKITPPAATAPVDDGQWLMPAKNYANTRYSALDQINTGNVADLQVAFTFSVGVNRGQEAAPIVAGGTMYVVTPYRNIPYALDLSRPGAPLKWQYNAEPDPAAQGVACCDTVNRGPTYAEGRVHFVTLDGHAGALDAGTDKVLSAAPFHHVTGHRASTSHRTAGLQQDPRARSRRARRLTDRAGREGLEPVRLLASHGASLHPAQQPLHGLGHRRGQLHRRHSICRGRVVQPDRARPARQHLAEHERRAQRPPARSRPCPPRPGDPVGRRRRPRRAPRHGVRRARHILGPERLRIASLVLIGLHTAHLVTDLGDTLVLTALMFTRHAHGKRFSDVEDNAFYWNFVVVAWLFLYGLLYWVPRL